MENLNVNSNPKGKHTGWILVASTLLPFATTAREETTETCSIDLRIFRPAPVDFHGTSHKSVGQQFHPCLSIIFQHAINMPSHVIMSSLFVFYLTGVDWICLWRMHHAKEDGMKTKPTCSYMLVARRWRVGKETPCLHQKPGFNRLIDSPLMLMPVPTSFPPRAEIQTPRRGGLGLWFSC